MKKTINILKLSIIFTLIIIFMGNCIYANDTKIDTDISMLKHDDEIEQTELSTRRLLGTMQTIGSLISVIALVIIGIRYMLSSLEEKSKLKSILIYYVVGAIMVFATSNIVGIAFDIITNL